MRCSEASGAARWLGRSFTLHLLTEPAGLVAHERALLDLAFGPAPRKIQAKMATLQRLLASRTIRLGRALNDDMRQITPQGAKEAAVWRAFAAQMKRTSRREAGLRAAASRQWLPLAVAMGLGREWASRMVEAGGHRAVPAWFESAGTNEPRVDRFVALIDACSIKTGTPHGNAHGTTEAIGAATATG